MATPQDTVVSGLTEVQRAYAWYGRLFALRYDEAGAPIRTHKEIARLVGRHPATVGLGLRNGQTKLRDLDRGFKAGWWVSEGGRAFYQTWRHLLT